MLLLLSRTIVGVGRFVRAMMKADLRQKRKCALLIILVFAMFSWMRWQKSDNQIRGFIHSAYYYTESKSLGKNAIALVLTANKKIVGQRVEVIGTSPSVTRSARAEISIEYEAPGKQFVTALLQTNLAVDRLEKLEIDVDGVVFEVPFQTIASTPKTPVVFCVAPQLISEHWQPFVAQVHTARHFGAHLHFYFTRLTDSFFELVREYESLGLLTGQAWIQYEKANRGAVFTDCLLQYKERAEYVVFLEPDEILVPKLADSYFEEYMREFRRHPLISSLRYEHLEADVKMDKPWDAYSILEIVQEVQEVPSFERGRLAVRTEMFNSTGPKFSVIANTRENSRVTKKVDNRVVQLIKVEENMRNKRELRSVDRKLSDLLTEKQLEAVENDWKTTKNGSSLRKIGENLPIASIFTRNFKECLANRVEDCRNLISSQMIDQTCIKSDGTVITRPSEGAEISFSYAIEKPIFVRNANCFTINDEN